MTLFQFEFLSLLFLPGFAITFLIGWRRSRGKPSFLKITLWASLVGAGFAAVLYAGLLALFFYMMRDRVVDHYTTPLTVEQARQQDCPIPLPNSARNVQFVVDSGGLIALEILVRFEAPVEICRNHVHVAFDAWEKQNQHLLMPSLIAIDHTPSPEDKDMVGRASWFDVEKIKHGLRTDSSYDIQFWIDEDRGIFYCKITD
jgi:hypothetical protein